MTDMAWGSVAVERAERSNFGLVALIVLALAAGVVGLFDPTATVAEYQTLI